MPEIPIPSISWGTLSKFAYKAILYFGNRLKIDVEFDQGPKNPFIIMSYEMAQVKYQLTIRTHGLPKLQPNVIFTKIKNLGDVVKKTVSPSSIGDVNGSMRLKLYKSELPSDSAIPVDVNFEIKIDSRRFVTLNFSRGQDTLSESNTEIEVLCTNECDFDLEQIMLKVKKDRNLQIKDLKIFVLDKITHNKQKKINARAIIKGDDEVKWLTRLGEKESLLFKLEATKLN